jgi:hypothetical protein
MIIQNLSDKLPHNYISKLGQSNATGILQMGGGGTPDNWAVTEKIKNLIA